MQNCRKCLYRAIVISPLILFVLYSLAFAHKRPLNPDPQIVPTARGDQEITLSIRTSDDRIVTVSQYPGEMIRTGPRGGEMLGITPFLMDDGSVRLEFSQINKIIKRKAIIGESITSLGSMELHSSLPMSPRLNRISTIQLVQVSKSMEQSVTPQNGGECPCCVTCDGEETCGISVQASCGSCRCR
jgi:hypothetical protein